MWEVTLLATTLSSLFGGGTWLTFRAKRKRVDRWQRIVKSHSFGVTGRNRGYKWHLNLEGRREALEIKIESSRRLDAPTRMILSVPGPPGSGGLRIRREQTYRPGAREVEIGDGAFDSTFSIEGPVRIVAALLDMEVRELLSRLNASCRRAGIIGNEIVVEIFDKQVAGVLPLLLKIAGRFSRAMDAAECLADNARRDPEAGVRLLNLRLLARDFPGEAVTIETLRQACSDPSLRVRLQAAVGLGDEGRDVLLELAEGMVIDECSAQAVSALGQALPLERARHLLTVALYRRRQQTARACVELLGRNGGAEAVDVLARVLVREEGEVAVAAALALGEIGGGEAEPPLIQALREGKTDVRVAAATSLGRVGSVAAVLPLKEVAETIPSDPELRKAARQAVAEIQSRLSGASPGQLSLAGDEAGQLSLAEAEAGQLSLAVDPGGQLSLPEPEAPQRPERTSG